MPPETVVMHHLSRASKLARCIDKNVLPADLVGTHAPAGTDWAIPKPLHASTTHASMHACLYQVWVVAACSTVAGMQR